MQSDFPPPSRTKHRLFDKDGAPNASSLPVFSSAFEARKRLEGDLPCNGVADHRFGIIAPEDDAGSGADFRRGVPGLVQPGVGKFR